MLLIYKPCANYESTLFISSGEEKKRDPSESGRNSSSGFDNLRLGHRNGKILSNEEKRNVQNR